MGKVLATKSRGNALAQENVGTRVSHLITCNCGFSTRKPLGFATHALSCNGKKSRPKKVWDRQKRKWVRE